MPAFHRHILARAFAVLSLLPALLAAAPACENCTEGMSLTAAKAVTVQHSSHACCEKKAPRVSSAKAQHCQQCIAKPATVVQGNEPASQLRTVAVVLPNAPVKPSLPRAWLAARPGPHDTGPLTSVFIIQHKLLI